MMSVIFNFSKVLLIALFLFSHICFANEEKLVVANYADMFDYKEMGNAYESTVKGKTVLILDTMKATKPWPLCLVVDRKLFKNGKLYIIEFDYEILEHRGGNFHAARLDNHSNKGGRGYIGTVEFGRNKGDKGFVKVTAPVAKDNKAPCKFIISVPWGSKIAISKFTIKERDWKGDWFNDKKLFFGVKPSNALWNPGIAKFDEPMFSIAKEKFFPMIDKYGQFKHRNWEGKIKVDSDFKKRLVEEAKFNKSLGKIKNRDKFGGLVNPKYKFDATGRFRVQKIEDKWFFITPEGNLFWSLGINSIGDFTPTLYSEREFYFEKIDKNFLQKGRYHFGAFNDERVGKSCDYYNFIKLNQTIKYGEFKWWDFAKRSLDRMDCWGFNTIGSFSRWECQLAFRKPFIYQVFSPHCGSLKITTKDFKGYWGPFQEYFNPNFKEQLKRRLLENAHVVKSPYCIGVLVDNELSWQEKNGMLGRGVLSTPENQYTKIAAIKMLKEKYNNSISLLNKAWGSSFATWDALLKNTTDLTFKTEAFKADTCLIDKMIAEKYFKTVREAINEVVGKDVLYISCRFAWRASIPVKTASEICDVIGMNVYAHAPSPMLNLPKGIVEKPVIIGEFSFAAGHKGNFVSDGWCFVRSDEERVDCINYYINDALANPLIIGAHWFQWQDQPMTGREDGEAFGFGLLDICDTPHYETVKAFHSLSKKMYKKRLTNKK